MLHHISDYPAALRELHRVLTDRGALLVAEPQRPLVELPILRTLFPHPREAQLTARELEGALRASRFSSQS